MSGCEVILSGAADPEMAARGIGGQRDPVANARCLCRGVSAGRAELQDDGARRVDFGAGVARRADRDEERALRKCDGGRRMHVAVATRRDAAGADACRFRVLVAGPIADHPDARVAGDVERALL